MLATCGRCRTSYHPKCWKLNSDRCAIYKCAAQSQDVYPEQSDEDRQVSVTEAGAPDSPLSPDEYSRANKSDLLVLGWLMAVLGIMPFVGLYNAVAKGWSLLAAFIDRPIQIVLSVLAALFPFIWGFSFLFNLRGKRRRLAIYGAVVVLLWTMYALSIAVKIAEK